MASFSGTQTKCKACGKTAYPMEQTVAEGVILHKGCFRCSHCKNTLKLNSFVSLEGVFYCKPHFEQLFQATGSFAKSFDDAIKSEREKPPPPESVTGDTGAARFSTDRKAPNPLASKFGGTQEKCSVCGETVYLLEKITVEGSPYHKGCFKCSHGGCTLSTTNSKTHIGKLYCTHHFNQLFLKKGNFSTLQEEAEAGAVNAGASPEPSLRRSSAHSQEERGEMGQRNGSSSARSAQPTSPTGWQAAGGARAAAGSPALAETPEKQKLPPPLARGDDEEDEEDEDNDEY